MKQWTITDTQGRSGLAAQMNRQILEQRGHELHLTLNLYCDDAGYSAFRAFRSLSLDPCRAAAKKALMAHAEFERFRRVLGDQDLYRRAIVTTRAKIAEKKAARDVVVAEALPDYIERLKALDAEAAALGAELAATEQNLRLCEEVVTRLRRTLETFVADQLPGLALKKNEELTALRRTVLAQIAAAAEPFLAHLCHLDSALDAGIGASHLQLHVKGLLDATARAPEADDAAQQDADDEALAERRRRHAHLAGHDGDTLPVAPASQPQAAPRSLAEFLAAEAARSEAIERLLAETDAELAATGGSEK